MIAAGTRLGPYVISAPIGAGGMGEVYRATDTNLKRAVAIKVLPASVAADRERLARFQREAEVLASLNHPNIAAIYGLERSDGVTALVMELIEGPTLADRIGQGPIPIDEALPIARQVAEALEAAHEQGIIHRDLKPANIKVRPDGTVKVLDFGLAKAMEPAAIGPMDATASPTITSPALMTGVGVLLGTAAYMSPEQARGKPVDKRSDIWAFGCVLYEMLTGRRAFEGDDVTETLAAVVMRDPDWTALPIGTPISVKRLLRRALQRDRRARLADIADARLDLEDADASPEAVRPAVTSGRYRVPIVAGAAAILVVAAWWTFWPAPQQVPEPLMFEVPPPVGTTFANRPLSLSPDGRHLAFVAIGSDRVPRIWIRSMGALEPRELRGTENAAIRGNYVSDLCWSPDSRTLAFVQEGKLKRIDISGDASQTLCEMCGEPGSWGPDGLILTWMIEEGIIRRVSASGGSAVPVAIPRRSGGGDVSYHYPHFLPDGRHFIFVRLSNEGAGIYVRSLDDPPNQAESQMLLPLSGSQQTPVVYTAMSGESGGHLLYMQNDTLMAQPFDANRLALTGEAVPVVNGIARMAGGRAMFSIATTGALAYRRGSNERVLRWFGGDGKALDIVGAGQSDLELSPDGARVVAQTDPGLSVIDLARGLRMPFMQVPSRNGVWSPDGQRIAFSSFGPDRALFVKSSNGASPEELLLDIDQDITPNDWSPDGRFLIYATNDPRTNWDLWVLPLTGARTPRPLVQTTFADIRGQYSPDGRWIAYQSSEADGQRVYVRPFPETAGDPARRWTVDSGSQPRWARDGKELFYIRGDAIWSVDVMSGEEFRVGVPRRIVPLSSPGPGFGSNAYYDVAPDGRFLVTSFPETNLTAPITVTLNWRTLLAH